MTSSHASGGEGDEMSVRTRLRGEGGVCGAAFSARLRCDARNMLAPQLPCAGTQRCLPNPRAHNPRSPVARRVQVGVKRHDAALVGNVVV